MKSKSETSEFMKEYINDNCNDTKFLCNNREQCSKNGKDLYGTVEDINLTCKNFENNNKCKKDINECIVQIKNKISNYRSSINAKFNDIIVNVPGTDKFIRLPDLLPTKDKMNPNTCSICECFKRFANSSVHGSKLEESKQTANGQDTCTYDYENFIYYPISLQEYRDSITNPEIIKFGDLVLRNSNIIVINSDQELEPDTLLENLLSKDLPEYEVKKFITDVLYKSDNSLKLRYSSESTLPTENTKPEKINDSAPTNIFILIILLLIMLVLNLKKK